MRSHPAKGLIRWLWGHRTQHTGAVGRPGLAFSSQGEQSELTVVIHNLIGTAEKVRPNFSEVHGERTKKTSQGAGRDAVTGYKEKQVHREVG